MNAKHAEFLAYDRIADLRREASSAQLLVDARSGRAPWRTRIPVSFARTVGRLRLALRLANA
jgi:hypothetical protein